MRSGQELALLGRREGPAGGGKTRVGEPLETCEVDAEVAAVGARRSVDAGGDDRDAVGREGRARELSRVAAEVEEPCEGARVEEAGLRRARGHDPAAVRAEGRVRDLAERRAQDAVGDLRPARDVPDDDIVVAARGEKP